LVQRWYFSKSKLSLATRHKFFPSELFLTFYTENTKAVHLGSHEMHTLPFQELYIYLREQKKSSPEALLEEFQMHKKMVHTHTVQGIYVHTLQNLNDELVNCVL